MSCDILTVTYLDYYISYLKLLFGCGCVHAFHYFSICTVTLCDFVWDNHNDMNNPEDHKVTADVANSLFFIEHNTHL